MPTEGGRGQSGPKPGGALARLLQGLEGLGPEEVAAARARGEVNRSRQRSSRSLGSIIRANVFTRFNAILSVLTVVVLILGSPKDALFGIVMVLNSAIGIVQELRAKRTLDRLSILTVARVQVLRGRRLVALPPEEIVKGDLVVLEAGDQVPADGEVVAQDGLEVDEALLTGESVPVARRQGERLMSGSVVVAGQGVMRATTVGEAAYAARLAAEARVFRPSRSEINTAINRLLAVISWALGPVALALWLTEREVAGSLAAAAVATVSGLVGLIPQGLVLLTSMSFAVAVIRLGRQKALVQDLPAVEVLARVDVLCFDKTGTLTTGRLVLGGIEPLGREGEEGKAGVPPTPEAAGEAGEALGALARSFDTSRDPILAALARALPDPGWQAEQTIAFSPQRRWSGARFAGHGAWVMGAPEVILGKAGPAGQAFLARAQALADEGLRLVALARVGAGGALSQSDPGPLEPVALVLLREELRPDAADTIARFRREGVALKVISGDSPLTAAHVAGAVGLGAEAAPVDASDLPDDPEALGRLVEGHAVFGRVGPHEKRAMVAALKARGHTVAMLGDGVNDVLAIKEADLGLTVGSGAPAARAVAQIILTDGRFAVLPAILVEGRRILANIERVAVLFITKTTYTALLILAVTALGWSFPLLPRHFTLIDAFTIGIPGFVLSLGPARQRFRPGLLRRILRLAVPAGALVAAAVLASLWALGAGLSLEEKRSLATAVVGLAGLGVLAVVARPLASWRGALVLAMALGFAAAFALPVSRAFFALSLPGLP